MTKRAASYDIDPVTYEEKERDNQEDNLYAPGAPQIKNRKIYILKRQTQGAKLSSQSKPDLKIIGLSDSISQKYSKLNTQPDQATSKQSIVQSSIFKNTVSDLTQSSNLFASLFSKDFNKPTINADAKTNQVPKDQQQSNKPKSSLFGSIFNQGSSSSAKSIFSFNSNHQTTTNLFSLPSKSLFSGTTNLFGNTTTKSGNLFSKQIKNEDGEQQGDSAQLQKKQQMIVDPSKSQVKYDYGKQNIVFKTVKLLKFKKDKGQLLDCPLTASIIRDHSNIQMSITHKVIFTGLILRGKSIVKTLNNKLNNLEILAFNIDPHSKKIQNHILKLQISTESKKGDEIDFHQALIQIIEGKIVSKNQGENK